MKKLLLCASIASALVLCACGKAPEATQTAAAQAPATEASAAQAPAKANDAKDAVLKRVEFLEKRIPKDFGDGTSRNAFSATEDNRGVVFSINMKDGDFDPKDETQKLIMEKAITVGFGQIFCKNGQPQKEMVEYLTGGNYLLIELNLPRAPKASSFKFDENSCKAN